MDNELYDQLLNELKSGCTLILGPEFCRLDEDDTLNENLRDFIANKHLGVKTYINEDGFFYSNKITKKNYIVKRIGEYYRNLSNGEIPFYYNLLAQMPFSFII